LYLYICIIVLMMSRQEQCEISWRNYFRKLGPVYGELGGVIVTSTLRSQSQPGSCLALVADWSRSIRERHLGIHLGGGSGMAMWRDVVESWRTAGVQ
jgi:hypothetical protein